MQSIAGLWSPGAAPLGDGVDGMLARLRGFGSRTAAVWSDRLVAFGALGYQTAQLTTAADRGLTVVADARIDNRDEVAAGLADRALATGGLLSDARLILESYWRWGDDAIARLAGDYAFAIWDAKRRRLVCARDAFGIRPLLFAQVGGGLAFASELAALLSLPGLRRQLNEERLAAYLVDDLEETGQTLFSGVSALPGGHLLVAEKSTVQVRRYWEPALEPSAILASDSDYAEGFRELFMEAIRCRMPALGPLGTTLSGGMDSSAITCVARNVAGQREQTLHSFTAIYEESPECDEREFSDAVVSAGGIQAHQVLPERFSPLAWWPGRSPRNDEPSWNPQVALVRAVYDAAREAGVTVMLEGYGGDEIVSHGLAYLTELISGRHWVTGIREMRAVSTASGQPLARILWRRAVLPFAPRWAIGARRGLRHRRGLLLSGVPLQPDFARRTHVFERDAAVREGLRPARSECSDYLRQLSPMAWGTLLRTAASAASIHGIDVRYPLLDRRLAEFCLSLPGDQKLLAGVSRLIIRRALADVLPEPIRRRRSKADLGPSFVAGLRGAYVDFTRLEDIWERFLRSGSAADAMVIWRVVNLACWLDEAFGQQKAPERPLAAAVATA